MRHSTGNLTLPSIFAHPLLVGSVKLLPSPHTFRKPLVQSGTSLSSLDYSPTDSISPSALLSRISFLGDLYRRRSLFYS